MKKSIFSLLMLSAMFMIASCGSKSNSGEATEATQENEAATPTYEPAEPPFTYTDGASKGSRYSDGSLVYGQHDYENVPLKGVFEISKISLAKVTGKIYYSAQLSGEGDCLTYNIHLKMIADYPQKPDYINGKIQFLNKDDAMLYETDLPNNKLENAVKDDVVILSKTTNKELDVDAIIANTRYVRITEFRAGKRIEE